MKIRAFAATYLLFLCVMFSSVGIVSAYLTNSQMNILREKSISQFRTIAASLTRDMNALQGRNFTHRDFEEAAHNILTGHQMYYARHNVSIGLFNLQNTGTDVTLTVVTRGDGRFIYITGFLPPPFYNYKLNYSMDISAQIAEMQGVQNMLMLAISLLSVAAAAALYFILTAIFKPFGIVAQASRKIAGGEFGERINIKGNHELARLAQDFNHMAARIESQIRMLEEEAIAKQQFVDNFAHEIRTPLTSIYGYAEYLQKTDPDEQETIESTEYIMGESRHMRNIANSLLELAVLRDYVPVRTEINLAELFREISITMEGQLRKRGARFVTNADAVTVQGQEDLIKSLLLNLCQNALHATGGSEGVIELEAVRRGSNVIISVKDNGCGIPEEYLPKIMDPFYRADKSRSREHGGTGLGLALCGQIAKVHGAEIIIESAVGKGTKVFIKFTDS